MSLSSIVPKWIGKPVFSALNRLLGVVRKEHSAAIPRVELSEKHLRNLRVVPDREAFLQQLPKHGTVAEVGVASGDFSAMILRLNDPVVLHLVDFWGSDRYAPGRAKVEGRFREEIAAGKVVIDLGLSTDALPKFPDATFDWVYIDTDHGYPITAAELEIARTKVKPGGIIAGHDYVTGNWDGGIRYGVVEAVHEFCVKHDWELILLTHETDRHLSFAIRRITA
ncbi:MAG TPA: class I SAM-dependent methyltransferase [Flavobacteriales bacterium]|jgi:predicted O-methyltransferase YrrM|nr:class I SAM-dependent methyltransferase [Flavobacteriales bacterium]HQW32747.1 class I SAM-dependent methyltransferase [Flavobacteriales bacterium]HQY03299.1 class I SAM-dependent methyltransferase [Flavobacteriales bacterium]HQY80188.1 class I SAM-dependent methyltransferase [Flavobacteriales bacterium]HRA16592.1 class I SAM-dependent methyltransferase [Flavobacteriales bacterium]